MLIEHIKNNALLYSIPFAQIVSELSDYTEFKRIKLSEIFLKINDADKDIPHAWRDSIKEIPIQLSDYEKDVIIHFGEKMCFCNKEEIASVAENALYSLNCFKETAVENRNTRSKSTAAICVSLGIIIILMFA